MHTFISLASQALVMGSLETGQTSVTPKGTNMYSHILAQKQNMTVCDMKAAVYNRSGLMVPSSCCCTFAHISEGVGI